MKMLRVLRYALPVVYFFSSCSGVKTLEGRAKSVSFTADPGLFSDTVFPSLVFYHQYIAGLDGQAGKAVELTSDTIVNAFIRKPTFFVANFDEFLVYPGEHIFVSGDSDKVNFSTLGENRQRDQELLVLQTFRKLEKWPKLPNCIRCDLSSILTIELRQKEQIRKAEITSQQLFDSLCVVYNVSKKFKALTKEYVHGRYDLSILGIYQLYRDTLAAHQLYLDKVRGLLPLVNGIKKASEFTLHKKGYADELYSTLFPNSGIVSMKDEAAFKTYFDHVASTFTGMTRDYLLSRIMYRAVEKDFSIPSDYQSKYKWFSRGKEYQKIVKRLQKMQKQVDKTVYPNEMLLEDGKTKTAFEVVLEQHKGKYVYVDLWATWCPPCKRELPYLAQLSARYPRSKIVFLSISIDSSPYTWYKQMKGIDSGNSENYLLLNSGQTSLEKEINLSTVPRYLLYDKEGKLLDPNAPWPSDPALHSLLNKLMLE